MYISLLYANSWGPFTWETSFLRKAWNSKQLILWTLGTSALHQSVRYSTTTIYYFKWILHISLLKIIALTWHLAQVLLDGYIMVGIDGVEIGDGSDWFCYHASSHAILPVGYCESNNIPLTLPPGNVLNLLLQLFSLTKINICNFIQCLLSFSSGYDHATFTWAQYLEETGTVAAPQRLFNTVNLLFWHLSHIKFVTAFDVF